MYVHIFLYILKCIEMNYTRDLLELLLYVEQFTQILIIFLNTEKSQINYIYFTKKTSKFSKNSQM